jgi:hypothetical protein
VVQLLRPLHRRQADTANKRITDAIAAHDAQPGPGDEGDNDSEQAS